MKTKLLQKSSALRLLVMLVILMSLAACRQPASTQPAGEVTPTEDMSVFVQAFTATAGSVVQPTATPAPEQVPPGQADPGTAGQEPGQQTDATPVPQTQDQNQGQGQVSQSEDYPEPTEGIPQSYTIQKGEYPYCIARRFDVNPAELLSMNGLGPSSMVNPGAVLRIPQTGNPFVTDRALKNHPTTYTVAAGDTIYTIACAFGDVSPDMIALVNDLEEPYVIQVGDKLNIP